MRARIDQIIPDPNQPRKTFDEEAIKELAGSFESYGIISPLKVRPYGDNQYMIVTGELRWRAAKLRGDKDIEVGDPVEVTDQQASEMQFIENLERTDIPDEELGRSFISYCQQYKCTMAELARRIGKPRFFVEERVAVATKLHPRLHKEEASPLTFTEKRELTKIEDKERQLEVAQVFITGEVSSTHIAKICEIAHKEPNRPIADIVEEVKSGKAKEEEMTRLEAAKRASGITIETPEELTRAARALKKEAERKAKEAMTPEEKAEEERKKLIAEAHKSLDSTGKAIDRASQVTEVSQFRGQLERIEQALEREPAEAKVRLKALGQEVREAEKKAKAEIRDKREEEKRQRIEAEARKKVWQEALNEPEFLKIAVGKAETVLPAEEVRRAVDYPTSLSDKHLSEIFRASPETWNDLVIAAEKRGWTPVELTAVVDIIKDEGAPDEYKAQLLQGEADPVVSKEGQPAVLKDTLGRRFVQELAQSPVVALTEAWDALSKLEQFNCKEVIDVLETFYLERVVKDTPRDVKYLNELTNLARERLELYKEVDE